jgi:crotonobetainyl-CoA:carnitine CoA-transferase CaiB-like acyl-CoA transferase
MPDTGEHTEDILTELGYDPQELERLRAGAVVQ